MKHTHKKYCNGTDFFSPESINSIDDSVVIRKKFFSLLDVSESDKHYTPQGAIKKRKAKHVSKQLRCQKAYEKNTEIKRESKQNQNWYHYQKKCNPCGMQILFPFTQ